MKKILTAVVILTVCFAIVGFAQPTKWQFVKVFPDTNVAFGTGVHGLAVSPDGKIWIGQGGLGGGADSLPNGKKTAQIYVYNPDGTPAAFSGIKVINTPGASDTLTALCRGMRADPDGNIAFAGVGGFVYKLDYKTGVGIVKVNPIAPTVASLTAPAFTDAKEMFTAHVAPGNPIKIWGSDFGSLGTAVTSSQGYSRTLEVSKDGNNIYWCGYTTRKVYVYHSDIGTLGTYTLTDSMMNGALVESTGWNKKDGLLYMSAGNVDTADYGPLPDAPWRAEVWYGMNVTTKTAKDSIVWNRAAFRYDYTNTANSPRPRAIDFSVTGDTAYVAGYNWSKAAIQMFKRVATSVEEVSNLIPGGYALSQNYPNPFNPSTEIQFSLVKAGPVKIQVFDILGKEVATLVNENLTAGTYKTKLDGSRLSSGTYIYTLTTNGAKMSKKMMLLK